MDSIEKRANLVFEREFKYDNCTAHVSIYKLKRAEGGDPRYNLYVGYKCRYFEQTAMHMWTSLELALISAGRIMSDFDKEKERYDEEDRTIAANGMAVTYPSN
jgi:hypothetical protein